MQNDKKEGMTFDDYFRSWIETNFGVTSILDIVLALEHKCLSEILDVEDKKAITAIGIKAYHLKMKKLRNEVIAMKKYFENNQDKIDLT